MHFFKINCFLELSSSLHSCSNWTSCKSGQICTWIWRQFCTHFDGSPAPCVFHLLLSSNIVNDVCGVVNIADQSSPSKMGSLPGYGRNSLHRVRQRCLKLVSFSLIIALVEYYLIILFKPQSTDFTQYYSYGDVCGGIRGMSVFLHCNLYEIFVMIADINYMYAYGNDK